MGKKRAKMHGHPGSSSTLEVSDGRKRWYAKQMRQEEREWESRSGPVVIILPAKG